MTRSMMIHSTKCAESERTRGFPQLLCKQKYGEREAAPASAEDKAECLCDNQYFCPQTRQWEIASTAINCNRRGGR